MEVRDSRRLTGPNLVTKGPAAVLDLVVEPGEDAAVAAAAWRRHAAAMLEAVGWGGAELTHRIFPGGTSLAFLAPIDALYAATEVNEWAWEAARSELAGEPAPEVEEAAERLRATIAQEVHPPLLALRDEATRRGVALLWDDDHVSVGLGVGSRTWPARQLPEPSEVPWEQIRDVPVVQVTGTNGKTTTVRLLAAMARAAGLVPGVSSTDWIAAGDDVLDRGDYSGPGGARKVLRDRRVECAILETARGGMLRRGLVLERTDGAAVTNVAADHLGEFGVHDLDALAECKFVVTRAARRLVLNADDPVVRRHGLRSELPVTWFTLDAADPFVAAHVAAGGAACALERGRLVRTVEGRKVALAEVPEIPLALGGAARYNIANALAAIGLASGLGLDPRAIGEGLRRFESTAESNPGRLNEFEIDGARVFLDFAHNPHGVEALLEMAAALPADRRLVTIGQAGDRDDESILELAAATWRARPDRILVKAMKDYLRGREEGEVPALLERELRRLGAGDENLAHTGSELDTARAALEWARPGDLVLLIVHSRRDEVVELLEQASPGGGGSLIEDPLALAFVIVTMTALAFFVSRQFVWAGKVGATLWVIAFGAVASNLGLVAPRSPVYELISGPITSLAIVWLLLAVDLRSLRAAGPRMLAAFALALAATVVGGIAAFAAVGRHFPAAGGDLAGVFVGTYSGGGLNFVSVGRALELPSSLFAAATAADNVVTALWLAATLLLPVWLGRFYAPPRLAGRDDGAEPAPDPMAGEVRLSPSGLAVLAALGLGVVLVAERLSEWTPGVPAILWLTTIALACAQLPAVRRVSGALQLGTLALHLFFAVLGIGSRVQEIAAVGVEVFYFAALVVLVHGALFLGVARLLRFSIDTVVVASQAAVGGPSTAMAVAVARGRTDLALPGAMVGLLGYALGTYAGLAVAWALSAG